MDYRKLSDQNIITELGKRLRQARINRNISQKEVAEKAGITVRTVQNIEEGNSSSIKVWVAVIRALNLLDQLDSFMPIQQISPIMLAEAQNKQRQRASKKRNIKKKDKPEW